MVTHLRIVYNVVFLDVILGDSWTLGNPSMDLMFKTLELGDV